MGFRRITINTYNLVSIGICYNYGKHIIEDAPSLQRLIRDKEDDHCSITVVSAPKLGTLGEFAFVSPPTRVEVPTFPDSGTG